MSKKVVEVKTLKVGKYVILSDEASKIVSIQTSSPGKHGAAKARVEAVGIFDNQKRTLVKPVDAKVDVPIIDKRAAQVLALMGSDVQLMDLETYETFEVPIPEELKDDLVEGAEVGYIVAMGQKKLMRIKGKG
jgi:translation initiation factor 5A